MEKEKQGAPAPIAIKKLTGMQVYTVTEGDCLGAVKDVLLDTSRKRAAALLVEEKGRIRDGRLIQFDKIQSIGDDAVIVADRGSVARASGTPSMVKIMQRPATLYGTRVISTAGMSLGRLEEYYIDKTSGEIRQLDLLGGRGHALSGRASLEGEYLLTIGRSAIMVDAKGAESLLEEQENHLQQAMSEVKEKAGQAWQSTVSASKRLGQNITSSLNRLLEEKDHTEKRASEETPATEVSQETGAKATDGHSPEEIAAQQTQQGIENVQPGEQPQATVNQPAAEAANSAQALTTPDETAAQEQTTAPQTTAAQPPAQESTDTPQAVTDQPISQATVKEQAPVAEVATPEQPSTMRTQTVTQEQAATAQAVTEQPILQAAAQKQTATAAPVTVEQEPATQAETAELQTATEQPITTQEQTATLQSVAKPPASQPPAKKQPTLKIQTTGGAPATEQQDNDKQQPTAKAKKAAKGSKKAAAESKPSAPEPQAKK